MQVALSRSEPITVFVWKDDMLRTSMQIWTNRVNPIVTIRYVQVDEE
jgi:hypothetical protein